VSTRTAHARRLFDGIAAAYDLPAEAFSFGQYGRWRRFAVERLHLKPGAEVLDVATGTGLVARDLVRRYEARVTGLDQSREMLRAASARGLPVVGASAERLPFPDRRFDAVTFTYLLRYVDDPVATVAELARVLRPGGAMASVEFGVPAGRWTRPLWRLYALRVLPLVARPISPGWRAAGDFLGPSITGFAERWPTHALEAAWRAAGMRDLHTRLLSFGAGVVSWGHKRD
jgi:demethylmenaquinone methyltransferase/2-methoxy-6-polyprenyl-1,4-benzoquinol methylase